MDERPSQEGERRKTSTALRVLILLLIAFFSGLLLAPLLGYVLMLGYFAVQGDPLPFAVLSAIFPLLVGRVAVRIANRRSKHPIILSWGIGMMVLAGVSAWFPYTLYADENDSCRYTECHFSIVLTNVLVIYVLYAAVLVLFSTVVPALIIKFVQRGGTRRARLKE